MCQGVTQFSSAFILCCCLAYFSGSSVCFSVPTNCKMVYSDYVKQRILVFRRSGKSYEGIAQSLADRHVATKVGVCKFLRRYKKQGQSCAHLEADMLL